MWKCITGNNYHNLHCYSHFNECGVVDYWLKCFYLFYLKLTLQYCGRLYMWLLNPKICVEDISFSTYSDYLSELLSMNHDIYLSAFISDIHFIYYVRSLFIQCINKAFFKNVCLISFSTFAHLLAEIASLNVKVTICLQQKVSFILQAFKSYLLKIYPRN